MNIKIRTCENKGIWLTKNGITFSIQFGAGNYCGNYNTSTFEQRQNKPNIESFDCEIAVIKDDGKWITNLAFPENGEHVEGAVDVIGYVPIEKALRRFLEFTDNFKE